MKAFCTTCGNELSVDLSFCTKCGAGIPAPAAAAKKSRRHARPSPQVAAVKPRLAI